MTNDKTILRAVGTTSTIVQISKKLKSKLLKEFDFYIVANELTEDEAKQFIQERPVLFAKDWNNIETWFYLEVKEPRSFYVIQGLSMSVPMTMHEAMISKKKSILNGIENVFVVKEVE